MKEMFVANAPDRHPRARRLVVFPVIRVIRFSVIHLLWTRAGNRRAHACTDPSGEGNAIGRVRPSVCLFPLYPLNQIVGYHCDVSS